MNLQELAYCAACLEQDRKRSGLAGMLGDDTYYGPQTAEDAAIDAQVNKAFGTGSSSSGSSVLQNFGPAPSPPAASKGGSSGGGSSGGGGFWSFLGREAAGATHDIIKSGTKYADQTINPPKLPPVGGGFDSSTLMYVGLGAGALVLVMLLANRRAA